MTMQALRTVGDILDDLAREAAPPLGHNNPPEPTLYEAAKAKIEDVRLEAGNWLDGAPVTSQDQADWLDSLLDMIKKAEKLADANRKAENEPFDTGKAEVQARYNPLLKQADTIKVTLQAALTPWKNRVAAEKAAAAKALQDEADRVAAIAAKARQTMDASNLAAREQAEALVSAAEQAQRNAKRAAKPTATGLRSVWTAELVNPGLYLAHLKATDAERLIGVLSGLADRDVMAGARELPGVVVTETKVAR